MGSSPWERSLHQTGSKRVSEASDRNKGPIGDVLETYLRPPAATVLEIASGTGQHCAYMATRFPFLHIVPSDIEEENCHSVRCYTKDMTNVDPPQLLNAADPSSWPVLHKQVDMVFNANMIHIAPIEVCCGLMQGSASVLRSGGLLALYGPFKFDGKCTSASNEQFDESLTRRDAAWGIRDAEWVVSEAEKNGLTLEQWHTMPANNMMVVFKKRH